MFVVVPFRANDGEHPDSVPIANGLIIAANVLLFFLGWRWFAGPDTGVFSIIGYGFSHLGLAHLIINMWVLLVFGNPVNRRVGNTNYLLAYLGTILFLGLFARLFQSDYIIGASGGVYAVIAMFAMLLPAVYVELGYIAVLPVTLLIGLFSRPPHWLYWLIRWDRCRIRGWWFILLVPALQILGLIWWPFDSGTYLGHLMGFLCGVVAVLMLPATISMGRRASYGMP